MDDQATTGTSGGDALKVGDWVRTTSSHLGKILLISRLSAFIDIDGNDELQGRAVFTQRTYED